MEEHLLVLVATTTIGGTGVDGSWNPLIAVGCSYYTARTTGRFATSDDDSTTSVGVVVAVPRSRWDDRPVFLDWIYFLGFRTPVSTKMKNPGPDGGDTAAANARGDDVVHHRRTWCAGSGYRYPLRCGG